MYNNARNGAYNTCGENLPSTIAFTLNSEAVYDELIFLSIINFGWFEGYLQTIAYMSDLTTHKA